VYETVWYAYAEELICWHFCASFERERAYETWSLLKKKGVKKSNVTEDRICAKEKVQVNSINDKR